MVARSVRSLGQMSVNYIQGWAKLNVSSSVSCTLKVEKLWIAFFSVAENPQLNSTLKIENEKK